MKIHMINKEFDLDAIIHVKASYIKKYPSNYWLLPVNGSKQEQDLFASIHSLRSPAVLHARGEYHYIINGELMTFKAWMTEKERRRKVKHNKDFNQRCLDVLCED